MPLSHDAIKSAVSAVRAGKHTPSHTAVLRNARNFLQNNKSHPWHKSDALRGAIGKVIGEASIDHVTPDLYRGAAKISRELSKGGGHVRLGRDSIKVKPMKKLNFLERYVANKVGIPQTLARAYTRGKQKYTRDNRLQKKHFNLGGTIESLPGNFAQTAPHITHELLHIKDPGVGGSGDARTHKEYLASRSEQHAYGGASILGVRHLKKMGVPHSRALAGLRAGDAGQAAAYVYATRKKGIPEFIQKTINRKNISIAREFAGIPNQYLAGEAGERPRRKMARELYKGIERTYGARNTTGGTTNKFGQVKLARPIGKLPEELQEKFDDFNFRINRYGQPDFREVDRGKPGDYTHWNIYKPDKDPVLRPKDPVVRRPARAQMDTPKPSTARDRALAWRKRQGVQESFPNIDKKALMERVKNSNLSL